MFKILLIGLNLFYFANIKADSINVKEKIKRFDKINNIQQMSLLDNKIEDLIQSGYNKKRHIRKVPADYGSSPLFWQNWANLEILTLYSSLSDKALSKNLAERINVISHGIVKDLSDKNFKKYFYNVNNNQIIFDDRQWLGLSILELYKVNGNKDLLNIAKQIFWFVESNITYSKSGVYQGIWWRPSNHYYNAITNELFFVFAVRLFALTHDSRYLAIAKIQYHYLFNSRMLQNNLFKDGLDPVTGSVNDEVFTYNQGIVLEGLAYMAVFDTKNQEKYLKQISNILNSSINYFKTSTSTKLIMMEGGSKISASDNTSSLFRGLFFRQVIYLHRILLIHGLWEKLVNKVPNLKFLILDNTEAVSRYPSKPLFLWNVSSGIEVSGNLFSQIYVLLAAKYLYSVDVVSVNGVTFACNNYMQINLNKNINKIILSPVIRINDKGKHKDIMAKSMMINRSGQYKFPIDMCDPQNTNNKIKISIIDKKSKSTNFILVHTENLGSRFAFINEKYQFATINSNCNDFRNYKFNDIQIYLNAHKENTCPQGNNALINISFSAN